MHCWLNADGFMTGVVQYVGLEQKQREPQANRKSMEVVGNAVKFRSTLNSYDASSLLGGVG